MLADGAFLTKADFMGNHVRRRRHWREILRRLEVADLVPIRSAARKLSLSDTRKLVTQSPNNLRTCKKTRVSRVTVTPSLKTRLTFSEHPDLVLSIPSFPKSKISTTFGVLNDEMSATDPKPVKGAQNQKQATAVRDKNILDSSIIIFITIWLDLDVPKVRLVKAYDR